MKQIQDWDVTKNKHGYKISITNNKTLDEEGGSKNFESH
jgi:hypothetical protein